MAIGEELKKARERKKMTEEQMAQSLSIPVEEYRDLEIVSDAFVWQEERHRMAMEDDEMAKKLEIPVEQYRERQKQFRPIEKWGFLLGHIAMKLEVPTSRLLATTGKSADTKQGQAGELIKKRREKKGLSLEDLTQKLQSSLSELQMTTNLEEMKMVERGESPAEKYGPLMLHFAEIVNLPVFNLLYP